MTKRVYALQGETSRRIAKENQSVVFNIILAGGKCSWSELLKSSGFSEPVLWKHLKRLMQDGTIVKDTIKLGETSNPEDVGKIIYRFASKASLRNFLSKTIELDSTIPHLTILPEDVKIELRKRHEDMVKFLSNICEEIYDS